MTVGHWTATMYAHCGMPQEIACETEPEDARAVVARYLRELRSRGFYVATLEPGRRWEATEPEDSVLVPDDAGIIKLEAPPSAECNECGCEFTLEEPGQDLCDESCASAYYGN